MIIIFDVGANFGTFSLDITRENPDILCFAFEPTPYLIDHLKKQSQEFSDRYIVCPYAVSNYVRKAQFHVSGNADWGCSSLLLFNTNLKETWPERNDFNVTDNIEVDVITIEYFLDNIYTGNISKIDFFHCDTQGSDLNVLKGTGRYIKLIKSGEVEAANKPDILYKNQNTKEDTINFLIDNGFYIKSILPNDMHQNEVNIEFLKINHEYL